jgi:cytochrome c oxidase subunit 2
MPIAAPERIWWKPLSRAERVWVVTGVSFLLLLSVSMPIWHAYGAADNPEISYRISPEEFARVAQDFIRRYQVGTYKGIPVVRPPAGASAYLIAQRFQWSPILELKKGETYHIYLSATDVQHGLSLQPVNMNFQVVPGYASLLTLTPTEAGVYTILCNQYCGVGHHLMAGRVIVKE